MKQSDVSAHKKMYTQKQPKYDKAFSPDDDSLRENKYSSLVCAADYGRNLSADLIIVYFYFPEFCEEVRR